jgi:ribose transport system substrate-binding protein
MDNQGKIKVKIKIEYAISIIFLVFVVLAVISMIYFYQQVRAIDNAPHHGGEYQFHYVMISDSPKDGQWREIFYGGSEKGQELGAFVENWGVYLQQDFSLCEQLEMAIAANVDGIIIKGCDNERILTLIDQGVEGGIPIVTLLTDVPGSERSAFISLNDYALGRIFGQQLLEVSEQLIAYGQDNIRVTVLTQSVWDIGISGVIYRGIHETIGDVAVNIEINSLEIGAQGEFEAEERIRDLFLSERTRPDVLISLNATNTIIAFQSLIDYNLVGQIRILGTSDNDVILDGIYQGIIHSSVFIDERNMGAQAISLLHSNVVVGYSSDYVTFNVELINLGNLYRFMYTGL